MGLPVSVLARGPAARSDAAAAAVLAVFAELRDVDATFSPYKPDSVVSRLARDEIRLGNCSREVRDVADRCIAAGLLTGGLFDAQRPNGNWDPSGLVKGWATERALRHLVEVADVDWCLNAGGDVAIAAPSGLPFVVGIEDPLQVGEVVAVVPCVAGGVATSGTAARGAHLYDPRTGKATTSGWASFSVTGPSLQTADVLATGVFVAGVDWETVVQLPPSYSGLGVRLEGTLVPTAGWPGS